MNDMYQGEQDAAYLEQVCLMLQKKLVKTYSQFGLDSGAQLYIINQDNG